MKNKGRKGRLDQQKLNQNNLWKVFGKKSRSNGNASEKIFECQPRSYNCLAEPGQHLLMVKQHDTNHHGQIYNALKFSCFTMEHQILRLRRMTQLTRAEYEQRYHFTKLFLTCLYRHHNTVYEGIIFGSTVNGLGFHESDVDLRLRPLKQVSPGIYEPVSYNDDLRDRVLRDIARKTTLCCPSIGDFVPSTRCPVAKLTFFKGTVVRSNIEKNLKTLQEGLKYDVSLSSTNPLSTFNSIFLRFLCYLEPKFHLLATVIRYWSSRHELIVPGFLSSYALINMLIFFLQTIDPPVLPTVDQMRDLYLKHYVDAADKEDDCKRGITQLEWHCMVCLKKEYYQKELNQNNEPLSVLLLKFFEFYLNFPYSTHIITTRPGRALSHEEYKISTQFHPRFPINTYLNIQDPFDLKHNLTSGMQGGHFKRVIVTMRYSYERLFKELLNHFERPWIKRDFPKTFNENSMKKNNEQGRDDSGSGADISKWGINCLFHPLTKKEMADT